MLVVVDVQAGVVLVVDVVELVGPAVVVGAGVVVVVVVLQPSIVSDHALVVEFQVHLH